MNYVCKMYVFPELKKYNLFFYSQNPDVSYDFVIIIMTLSLLVYLRLMAQLYGGSDPITVPGRFPMRKMYVNHLCKLYAYTW